MHHEHVRRLCGDGYRRKIPDRIVRCFLEQGPEHEGTGGSDQRVTVGRRLRAQRTEEPAAAGIDNDRLSEWTGDALREQARGDIGATADLGSHDAYGFGWILLGT